MAAARTFYIGNSRKSLLRALSLLAEFLVKPEDDYELEIRQRKRSRSSDQNRRYWAILAEISAGIRPQGQEFAPMAWHEYFKERFIGCEEVKLPNGKTVTRILSSTDLDVMQFGEYMTQIEAWAAQHGLLLTDPMAA